MPAQTVNDVVKELRGYGLDVSPTGTHWKVRDPKSGAWLFDISKTPSDHNWYWALRRHLRRIGLIRKEIAELGTKISSKGKKYGSIDLEALKRAQDAAAAAGERIPQLEDLETSPLLLRKVQTGGTKVIQMYADDASKEAIENMVAKADTPRLNSTRQRLEKFMEEKQELLENKARVRAAQENRKYSGRGEIMEFARTAIEEVAPARDLKAWKTASSGYQSLRVFLNGDSVSLWAVNLFEATMDHLEGMKWGPQDNVSEPEPEPEKIKRSSGKTEVDTTGVELEGLKVRVDKLFDKVNAAPSGDDLRIKYAEVLLDRLKRGVDSDNFELILKRLDKLTGLEV